MYYKTLQPVDLKPCLRRVSAVSLLIVTSLSASAQEFSEVERLLADGNAELALSALESVKPRSAAWHLLASRVFEQLDQPVRAASEAEEAVRLDQSSEANHLQLGQLLLTNNNPTAAHETFAQALERFRDSRLLRLGLGLALNRLQLYEEAEPEFRKVLGQQPALGIALDGLAEACIALVRYDAVSAAAAEFAATSPDDYRGYYYSALASDKAGLSQVATENLLRKAIQRNATHAPSHALLGKVLLEQGRPQEAAMTLEGAIRLRPGYAFGHLHLARAYRRLGRNTDADRHARRLKELESERGQPAPILRRLGQTP